MPRWNITETKIRTGSAPTVPVPAPAPGGAGQSATPIQLSDLQSILSNIQVSIKIILRRLTIFWAGGLEVPNRSLDFWRNKDHLVLEKNYQVPPGGEAIGAGGSGGPSVDLSTAMTGEALQPILSQEGFLDKVREPSYCIKSTQGLTWHILPGKSFSSCWWRGRKRSHRCRPKGGPIVSDLYFVSQIFKRKSLGHSPVASIPASGVHVLYGSSVRPDSPPGKIMSFLLKTAFLVDTCNI